MSVLLEVLLSEQLEAAFRAATARRPELNAALIPHPGTRGDRPAGKGTVARITGTDGQVLVVTPRRIAREVGPALTDLAVFDELVGYDWISTEMSEKVRMKDEHYDRLHLHMTGARNVVLDRLGPAVYPLMAFLGKVLELRSQKVLLRRLDDDVVEIVSRCLAAAVAGPFLTDRDLQELLEQDRPSLQVVAAMWQRMNLASPQLRRTIEGVLEMLLQRRHVHADAWDDYVALDPERVQGALDVFRSVTTRES